MNTNNVILIGLDRRVTAISKNDGRILWATELIGSMSKSFVTLLADKGRVFAYAGGHLHCLDLATGQILWVNELRSYGYGLATLSLPNGASAPDSATIQRIMEDQGAASSSTTLAAT